MQMHTSFSGQTRTSPMFGTDARCARASDPFDVIVFIRLTKPPFCRHWGHGSGCLVDGDRRHRLLLVGVGREGWALFSMNQS